MLRYGVEEGSTLGHCCFKASIVDTAAASDESNALYTYSGVVCECTTMENARLIAGLLNDNEMVKDLASDIKDLK